MSQPQKYQDLLAQVKQGQMPDQQRIPSLKQQAGTVCDEHGADLKGVRLEDTELVVQLVAAKFSESYKQEIF
jgi:hypothetical protein